MKKFLSLFITFFLFFLSSSCGRKGALYPPLIQIPQEIEIFGAIQRADKIILEWANPTAYIDGSPLKEIAEIEIWLAEEEKESVGEGESGEKEKELSVNEFEKKANLIASIKREKFSEYQKVEGGKKTQRLRYIYPLRGEEFPSKKFIFGLKVKDRKKKKSNFSSLLSVEPEILPLPPQSLLYTVFEDHLQITWNPPQKNIDQSSPANIKGYNIYRAEREAEPRRLNSDLIKENKYEDKDFLFEMAYHYFIRASATDSLPFLESDDSQILEVLAKDKFPPKVPTGLVLIPGENYIALSWDENQERDLAGYRVWRREEGEEEYRVLSPEPIRENAYNDTKVEKNKKYYYSITALDKYGNESDKSEGMP